MDRQCDVRCHEATHEICTCVCRGKFHGVANRPGGLQAVFATPSVTNLEALVDGSRVASARPGNSPLVSSRYCHAPLPHLRLALE